MTGFILIHATTPTAEAAERIAEALLADNLAACVQIAAVRSRYLWKGAVGRADEQLLMIKTRDGLFEQVRTRIRDLHGYETPEVVALPIREGDPDYLAWIEAETGAL